jgi:hypothetical protein
VLLLQQRAHDGGYRTRHFATQSIIYQKQKASAERCVIQGLTIYLALQSSAKLSLGVLITNEFYVFGAARRLTRHLRYGKTIKTARMKWAMLGWAVVGIFPVAGHAADSLLDTTLEDTKLYFTRRCDGMRKIGCISAAPWSLLVPPTRSMREFVTISQPARRPS